MQHFARITFTYRISLAAHLGHYHFNFWSTFSYLLGAWSSGTELWKFQKRLTKQLMGTVGGSCGFKIKFSPGVGWKMNISNTYLLWTIATWNLRFFKFMKWPPSQNGWRYHEMDKHKVVFVLYIEIDMIVVIHK